MTTERVTNILNLSAMYSFVFGAYIANPFTDLFHSSGALYAPMVFMVDSEPFWGVLMMLAAVLAFVLRRKGSPKGLLVMAAVFSFYSVLFFIGDPLRPGGAIFFILAAFNAIQYKAGDDRWNQARSQTG